MFVAGWAARGCGLLRNFALYCDTASTANTRNFAPYLSAILRASLYCGELYAVLASSRLLYLRTVTRVFGGSPSMDVPGPAARSWLPEVLSAACAMGANS